MEKVDKKATKRFSKCNWKVNSEIVTSLSLQTNKLHFKTLTRRRKKSRVCSRKDECKNAKLCLRIQKDWSSKKCPLFLDEKKINKWTIRYAKEEESQMIWPTLVVHWIGSGQKNSSAREKNKESIGHVSFFNWMQTKRLKDKLYARKWEEIWTKIGRDFEWGKEWRRGIGEERRRWACRIRFPQGRKRQNKVTTDGTWWTDLDLKKVRNGHTRKGRVSTIANKWINKTVQDNRNRNVPERKTKGGQKKRKKDEKSRWRRNKSGLGGRWRFVEGPLLLSCVEPLCVCVYKAKETVAQKGADGRVKVIRAENRRQ